MGVEFVDDALVSAAARSQGSAGSAAIPELDPAVDTILARGDCTVVGAFRCPRDAPQFADSGPIRQDCFVFPRSAVEIRHADAAPFVADPTVATLYHRGDRYTRGPVSEVGDRCDWFGVERGFARDAVRVLDRAAADEPERIFAAARATVSAVLYLEQRVLFERALRPPGLAPLALDEAVAALLVQVLAAAARGRAPTADPDASGARAQRRRRDRVEAARRHVLAGPGGSLSLREIARAAGCSPFHLCRAFRAETGGTLHRFVTQVRLRSALERIADGEDLTRVALAVGFSSHSHFSYAFRRLFGAAPTRAFARARSR